MNEPLTNNLLSPSRTRSRQEALTLTLSITPGLPQPARVSPPLLLTSWRSFAESASGRSPFSQAI